MYGAGGVCECGGDIEGAFGAGARGRDVGAAVRERGEKVEGGISRRSREILGRLRGYQEEKRHIYSRECAIEAYTAENIQNNNRRAIEECRHIHAQSLGPSACKSIPIYTITPSPQSQTDI